MAVNYQIEEDTMRPLVPTVTTARSPPAQPSTSPSCVSLRLFCSRRRHIVPKSKVTFLILLWNVIVGATYGLATYSIVGMPILMKYNYPFERVMYLMLGGYAMVAFAQILSYPVGGLIADLCCGRLKIVFFSLFKIWFAFLLLVFVGLIIKFELYHHNATYIIPSVISYLLIVAGFTGFQVNAVQFGLDQMLDSPSQELSAFLHWYVWAQSLGELLIRLLATSLPCSNFVINNILPYVPIPLCVVTGIILGWTCYNYRWFHSEPCTRNPYGTVYRVLKFAAKHDKPLRRSAFAYADDERPTRIEFAKQRFGGPFTTETVEDVKTFLRVFLMLFLITPVFNLHISTTYLFPLYGIHMGNKLITDSNGCTAEWMLLQSGNISFIIAIVAIPLYLIFVHPHIPRYIPKILHRLVLGLAMIVVTAALMFGMLIVAQHQANKNSEIPVKCIFLSDVRVDKHIDSPRLLDFKLPLLIIPNIFTGICVPLIYITFLEFISAQSPHAMKGLLLGVFYAFRGLFIMLGSLLVFFFVHEKWWSGIKDKVVGCGFGYYLTSTVLGVIGLVVVSLGVKWYHYRKRQDRPYDPTYVENYYQRYAALASASPDEPQEEQHLKYGEIDTSILAYGTMVGT